MMYPTNATLSIRPGTTPPISSFEIEIPDRLPRSTVRAEGGINISTAPIAMIGPVASTGLYPRDSMTGSINDPSMAVVAMVEPQMAENTGPPTTATPPTRPRARAPRAPPQPSRDLTNQALDSVDHFQGEPGMEENLAHQHEERNWRQREIDHRRGAVPEHLA